MDWNASLSISVLSCICGTNHHVTPVSVTPLRSAACQGLVLPKNEQKLGMRDELCGKVASVSDMDLYRFVANTQILSQSSVLLLPQNSLLLTIFKGTV